MSFEQIPQLAHESTSFKRTVVCAVSALALFACPGSNSETSDAVEIPPAVITTTPCIEPAPHIIETVKALEQVPDDDLRFRENTDALTTKLGLTSYDYLDDFYSIIGEDVYEKIYDPQVPAQLFVDTAASFLSKYSITMDLMQFDGKKKPGFEISSIHTNSLDEQQSTNLKRSVIDLSRNVSLMPVELIETIGLHKVNVANINGPAAAFYTPEAPNALFMDGATSLDALTFAHELTHVWDDKVCDDAQNDPTFTSLNPPNMSYDVAACEGTLDETKAHLTSSSLEYIEGTKVVKARAELYQLTSQPELSVADKQRKAFLEATINGMYNTVTTMGTYGFCNPVEDKATIGAKLFGASLYGMMGRDEISKTPLIGKVNILFARMYAQNPAVGHYLIALNMHSGK